MNASSSSLRLLAPALAILIAGFCIWQLALGIIRVQTVQSAIVQLQTQAIPVEQINPEKWIISSPSHGAAGANVQARLRSSSRASDVSLTRVEIQPPDTNLPNQIKASAQANGALRAIAEFIYQLESKTPALIIERARITVAGADNLDLDLVLLGQMDKGTSRDR